MTGGLHSTKIPTNPVWIASTGLVVLYTLLAVRYKPKQLPTIGILEITLIYKPPNPAKNSIMKSRTFAQLNTIINLKLKITCNKGMNLTGIKKRLRFLIPQFNINDFYIKCQ